LEYDVSNLKEFLFGIGTSTNYYYIDVTNYNAQNMYLEILISNGMIGIILFGTLMVRMLIRAFKITTDNLNNVFLLGCFVVICWRWMFN